MASLRRLIETLPRYAFDRDGSIYGPVDAGEGTFIRHEDMETALKGSELMMCKSDRIIADLVNALDAIRREAYNLNSADRSFGYLAGLADQAITNCNAERERNADGYLVVKQDTGR